MRRQSYRDRALVIRSYDFSEADRVIVLLTREHGLVRGVAKGVRRAKSRFGSRLQPFVELDVQLYPGRQLDSITGADTVAYFSSRIIEDFLRYSCGLAVLDVASRVAGQEENPQLFDTTVEVLNTMQDCTHPLVVLDGFMLKVMGLAGWAPALFNCAQCARPGPHSAFHPGAGGALCLYCRPPGSIEVPEEALHMMWLIENEAGEATVDTHPELINTVHSLVVSHFEWHIENKLPSLNVLNQA